MKISFKSFKIKQMDYNTEIRLIIIYMVKEECYKLNSNCQKIFTDLPEQTIHFKKFKLKKL